MAEAPDSTRLDKWLWAARCYKTRSQATAACAAGHVLLNGAVARPAHTVKHGDAVEVHLGVRGRRLLRVVGIGERRGSSEAADALFVDLDPPAPEPWRDPDEAAPAPPEQRDRGLGRPTKRDRRRIESLKGPA